MRRFKLSWPITVTSILLAVGMLRLSYWQWERHLSKKAYIAKLEENLKKPPLTKEELLKIALAEWPSYIHRRVIISGDYDFKHEMVLRNRRLDKVPGVHVLTPLKISGTSKFILVDRGFIPLEFSTPDKRTVFQKPKTISFTGLIKASVPRRPLSPRDPEAGPDKPWVDAWLRVNLDKIAKQLPFKILPVYLEIIPKNDSAADIERNIIKSDSDKAEMLFLPSRALANKPVSRELSEYPVPVFNTVVPPGRHLGYVYEWAFMALGTLIGGLLLQLKRI
ncbi:MAG: SURF1 family protein [Candidatus Dadabacteria bacterium]|nr:MAG: SURF1 family protein [Candidatus Dadabacteria bacterium]